MRSSYPKKTRGGNSRVQVDPATKLHDLTTKLFDKAEGHGADWAAAAEASFRVAFSCLHNLADGNPDRDTIARRVQEIAYNLIAGTADSEAPYRAAESQLHRPAFTMTDPAPGQTPRRPGN